MRPMLPVWDVTWRDIQASKLDQSDPDSDTTFLCSQPPCSNASDCSWSFSTQHFNTPANRQCFGRIEGYQTRLECGLWAVGVIAVWIHCKISRCTSASEHEYLLRWEAGLSDACPSQWQNYKSMSTMQCAGCKPYVPCRTRCHHRGRSLPWWLCQSRYQGCGCDCWHNWFLKRHFKFSVLIHCLHQGLAKMIIVWRSLSYWDQNLVRSCHAIVQSVTRIFGIAHKTISCIVLMQWAQFTYIF